MLRRKARLARGLRRYFFYKATGRFIACNSAGLLWVTALVAPVFSFESNESMEYASVIKKDTILPFAATWMDWEGTMLSEISQAENDKYCMISFIPGI